MIAAAALLGQAAVASTATAHNGVEHANEEEAAAHLRAEADRAKPDTAGFPDIKGGDYRLTDQHGRERTSRDPDGRYQLLFFGYAHCKAICSVALPRMSEAVDLLEADGMKVTPVLITVDPERDTIENLAAAVPKIHPRMIGLTGSAAALAGAYKAFQVERKVVFEHPEHGAVYAHGSYTFLLGPDGSFKTLLPPILSPERIAELVKKYADQAS